MAAGTGRSDIEYRPGWRIEHPRDHVHRQGDGALAAGYLGAARQPDVGRSTDAEGVARAHPFEVRMYLLWMAEGDHRSSLAVGHGGMVTAGHLAGLDG